MMSAEPQLTLVLVALFAAATTSSAQTPPPGGSAAPAVLAVVEQPRPYGYVVGDLLTQRVLLQAAGQSVTPIPLPPAERVNAWFERRRATIETDFASRRWLAVEYQVLNAPQKLTTVTLPAWQLTVRRGAAGTVDAGATNTGVANPSAAGAGGGDTGVADHGATGADGADTGAVKPRAGGAGATNTGAGGAKSGVAGGGAVALRIPAASINVAPLSPPGSPAQVGVSDLRPDRPPPGIATAPIRRAMGFWFGALVVTLAVWLAWLLWRNGRSVATQPFASALHEIRRLDDGEPRAWQAMHRAFDRTAGRVVQSATLPALFDRAPHLRVSRAQIEEFFLQSNALFFGGNSSVEPISPRELCIQLRRIERRCER